MCVPSQIVRFCLQFSMLGTRMYQKKLHLSKHQKPCISEEREIWSDEKCTHSDNFFHRNCTITFFSSSLSSNAAVAPLRKTKLNCVRTRERRRSHGPVQAPEFKLLILLFSLSLSGSLRAFNSNAPILLSNCYYSHCPISHHPSGLKNSRSEKYLPRGTRKVLVFKEAEWVEIISRNPCALP